MAFYKCKSCGAYLELTDKDTMGAGASVPCRRCGEPIILAEPKVAPKTDAEGNGTPALHLTVRQPPKKTCPACHAELASATSFICPVCGIDLRTGKKHDTVAEKNETPKERRKRLREEKAAAQPGKSGKKRAIGCLIVILVILLLAVGAGVYVWLFGMPIDIPKLPVNVPYIATYPPTEYETWTGFGPKSKAKLKIIVVVGDTTNRIADTTDELQEIKDAEAHVTRVSIARVDGRPVLTKEDLTYPREPGCLNSLSARYNPDAIPLTTSGKEIRKVADKEIECTWYLSMWKVDGRKNRVKAWYSDEVPGGIVYVEADVIVNGLATREVTRLTAFEVTKPPAQANAAP